MSKKYQELAKNIVDLLGGKDNVIDVYHCQIRLRFKLKDSSKVQKATLENLDGVSMYLINAGVHQVVIGTHVKDVYEEISPLVQVKSVLDESEEHTPFIQKIIDFIAGAFQPVIPALSGAGMVKAVLALLIVFKVIENTSQTYVMLNTFADGVFYFLPLILAFTTAQKLRANPILAVGVVAMMLHPNWINFVSAGEPV